MANGTWRAFLEQWRRQRLLILGLGVSNRPLARMLLAAGCRVTGCDRTSREQADREVLALEELGMELRLGPGYLDGLEADVVFRTPGMHPAHPALQALRAFFACFSRFRRALRFAPGVRPSPGFAPPAVPIRPDSPWRAAHSRRCGAA